MEINSFFLHSDNLRCNFILNSYNIINTINEFIFYWVNWIMDTKYTNFAFLGYLMLFKDDTKPGFIDYLLLF